MKTNAMTETTKPAPFAFRFEFPPEVAAEREHVLAAIRRQMAEGTRVSVAQAVAAQAAWLERFPDDYGMWDLGESLWMLADALEATALEGAAPEAAPPLLTR
jgi:hypothetical protein